MNFLILGKPLHLDFSNLSEPEELKDERENLENAHLLATETGQIQIVKIDGKNFNVEDRGYGREIHSI